GLDTALQFQGNLSIPAAKPITLNGPGFNVYGTTTTGNNATPTGALEVISGNVLIDAVVTLNAATVDFVALFPNNYSNTQEFPSVAAGFVGVDSGAIVDFDNALT